MPKGLCRQMFSDGGVRPWSEFNTYSTCIANGGKYMMVAFYMYVLENAVFFAMYTDIDLDNFFIVHRYLVGFSFLH